MSIRLIAAVALLAITSPVGITAASAQSRPLRVPKIQYEKYTLPNGLTVITHEDHRLPLVAVNLWYHVGPLNERQGRTGFAHLFEHMMFEGSEHVGDKVHMKFVQEAGGSANGSTNFDRTNYFETLPANQLELGLWLESDRMGFLMEGLDRIKLANQRDVVRNERRQSEGQPYQLADEEVYHLLFPQVHPYYAHVIGSHADIEAARITDIRDFHQQFYTPNNASIAIAGDFDPKRLKELLTKYFGPIPSGPTVAPVTVVTPAITKQVRAVVTDRVTLPQLRIAWLTPARYKVGGNDTDAAVYLLGGAKTSRLEEALITKAHLAQTVSCTVDDLQLTGIAECIVTAKPGVTLDQIEPILWSEIDHFAQTGPTDVEIQEAKAKALTSEISSLQRVGTIANSLNEYNQYTGDPGYLTKDIANRQAVTVASTRVAVKQYLTKSSAVVVSCLPGTKVLNDVPRSPDNTDAEVKLQNPYSAEFESAQQWRKTPPEPAPESAFHFPIPQAFTLKNGLKVYVVTDRSLPLLSVRLTTRAGSEFNSVDKAGLASLTAATVGEATMKLSRSELAEAEARIGAQISVDANMDMTNASFTATTNNEESGVALLADVIQHPAFAASDFDRLREQRLVSIAQLTDAPRSIAMNVGPSLVYGDHPYGVPDTGTVTGVKSITREDVVAFYKGHYGPAETALIFVGDISVGEARQLAEKHFAMWDTPITAKVIIPPAPPTPTRHIVIIDKPGSPQTALFAFGPGVPQTTPDMQALQIMNYTLGGSFNSRINMNLREEHGYSYGANSQFVSYREGGWFYTGGLVRTDATGPAAKELLSEISRFGENPPTTAELKAAKNARMQSLPELFEVGASTASTISSLFVLGRPLNYFAVLPEKYSLVTSADVARVAREDLHPDNLVFIAVGDRAKIEQGMRDANIGVIEARTVGGKVIEEYSPLQP